ncbi:hypothetical protein [Pseudoalteromonas rubra]|uniref:hypothetical protein n=1 Tax=Pseudoalteromonas rubra TaxID=43658 RepID=UPI0013DDF474|nr:hypothetical protein [Pseudoalteromonas rubra]
MNIKLNQKKLKNLAMAPTVPQEQTPHVAGGVKQLKTLRQCISFDGWTCTREPCVPD